MTGNSTGKNTPTDSSTELTLQAHFTYRHGFGALTPFFKGLLQGRVLATLCETCGKKFCPPRMRCHCGGKAEDWVTTSGCGVLRQITLASAPQKPLRLDGEVAFGLIQVEGCQNLIFARLDTMANKLRPGAKVRLIETSADVVHPIERLVFGPLET